MQLETIANIAEIVAAVLVVLSLARVSLEIRQHTKATRAATGQAWFETFDEHVCLINTCPNLADVLHRGANGVSNLEEAEIIQFGAFMDQILASFQVCFFQQKEGLLEHRLWSIQTHAVDSLMAQAGQQQWWSLRKHWYDREFQEFVDQLIKHSRAQPMHPFSVQAAESS